MSNITVDHAPSGLVLAQVERAVRLSPHIVRVTLGGPDVHGWRTLGFDQWFRLALPASDATGLARMPATFDRRGYLSYLRLPRDARPVVRNYTVRATRPGELDVDFVVHGDDGVAGPWAQAARPGDPVALIDQGCGWNPPAGSTRYLLAADETGMPAVAGILASLPRTAIGTAILELGDPADVQDLDAPDGVEVRWLVRAPGTRVGQATHTALTEVSDDQLGPSAYAFVVGESALATGSRRYLVRERGLAKSAITFCGYWKAGRH